MLIKTGAIIATLFLTPVSLHADAFNIDGIYQFSELANNDDPILSEMITNYMSGKDFVIEENTLFNPLISGDNKEVPLSLLEEDVDNAPADIGTCNLYLFGEGDEATNIWISEDKMLWNIVDPENGSEICYVFDHISSPADTTEKEPSNDTFENKYGTPTTKCAHEGCDNYIASSGDTNCCEKHSNRCLNCNKYIDEDAIYCMDCLSTLGGSRSGDSIKTSDSKEEVGGDEVISSNDESETESGETASTVKPDNESGKTDSTVKSYNKYKEEEKSYQKEETFAKIREIISPILSNYGIDDFYIMNWEDRYPNTSEFDIFTDQFEKLEGEDKYKLMGELDDSLWTASVGLEATATAEEKAAAAAAVAAAGLGEDDSETPDTPSEKFQLRYVLTDKGTYKYDNFYGLLFKDEINHNASSTKGYYRDSVNFDLYALKKDFETIYQDPEWAAYLKKEDEEDTLSDSEKKRIAKEKAESCVHDYIANILSYKYDADSSWIKLGEASITKDYSSSTGVDVKGTAFLYNKYGTFEDTGEFTVHVTVNNDGSARSMFITDVDMKIKY